MQVLINCSYCRTPLYAPPGAPSIPCAVCSFVTNLASPTLLRDPSHGPLTPLRAHVSKRAVICGISYRRTRIELKGPINDARCMRFLLLSRFGFTDSSILMLTEEENVPSKIPTKQNIRAAMNWLVQGSRPGDSLVFYFSGHGRQQKDRDGDERDGYDEAIVPLDSKVQGLILDDEINATLVQPLPFGAKLHAIIDTCHSGTMLDLPFLCRMNRYGRYVWEDNRPRNGLCKGTSGGEAFSFSACDDSQRSAESPALSKVANTGTMTFCFINAIENGHGATYGSLLSAMRSSVGKAVGGKRNGGPVTSLVSLLRNGGNLWASLKQEPQLTSSDTFDVHTKRFTL